VYLYHWPVYVLLRQHGWWLTTMGGFLLAVSITLAVTTISYRLVEQPIRDVFSAFYEPLAASFLALLAFFSLSAALRALRRRTIDALVILVVAMLVLALAALPQHALGAVVAGVRVLLGFDQPYLDR
jgi:peptidoglycan/LPS O-acetylase OafA/YrhL